MMLEKSSHPVKSHGYLNTVVNLIIDPANTACLLPHIFQKVNDGNSSSFPTLERGVRHIFILRSYQQGYFTVV